MSILRQFWHILCFLSRDYKDHQDPMSTPETKPSRARTIPLSSFIKNVRLIVAFFALIFFYTTPLISSGVKVFIVPFLLLCNGYLTWLAFRSFAYPSTIDKIFDNHSKVKRGWDAMSETEQVKIGIYVGIAFLLCFSLIAAAMLIGCGGFSGARTAIEATQ